MGKVLGRQRTLPASLNRRVNLHRGHNGFFSQSEKKGPACVQAARRRPCSRPRPPRWCHSVCSLRSTQRRRLTRCTVRLRGRTGGVLKSFYPPVPHFVSKKRVHIRELAFFLQLLRLADSKGILEENRRAEKWIVASIFICTLQTNGNYSIHEMDNLHEIFCCI